MPRETPSPLDLPEPDPETEGVLGWATGVILVASLVLLLTNAVSLRDWIDEQTPGPVQAQAAQLADQWLALSRAIGLAAPRDALHTQWKRAEGARFIAKGIVIPDNADEAAD